MPIIFFIPGQKCGVKPYHPTRFSKIKKDFTLEWLEKIGNKDLKECYPSSKTPSQQHDLLCKPHL